MKKLLYIAPLFLFYACSKYDGGEATLFQEVAGEWTLVDDPTRHYLFGEDYVTAWDYNFSTVVNAHWYKAQHIGERDMMLIEINKKDTVYWKFSELSGDTLVTVADATYIPAFYFDLKRK